MNNSIECTYEINGTKEENRLLWKVIRKTLESLHYKVRPKGASTNIYWKVFENMLSVFEIFLRMFNLYGTVERHAKNIIINNTEVLLPGLPKDFYSYRILFISDLHFDVVTNIEDKIVKTVEALEYDLVLLGGDFYGIESRNYNYILKAMEKFVEKLDPEDGMYAVLGNHDSYRIVDPMEKLGVSFLINESITIKRGNSEIAVTGVDDVFYFYTEAASNCLIENRDIFKIALVHSPDLVEHASKKNYDLYLCGHTHGGQICFPNGRHIVSHSYGYNNMVKGLWKYNTTKGFTTKGCGCSGVPIRLFCEPEVVILTLKSND
jgi:predicted MPP superfamily phosphohydrolase